MFAYCLNNPVRYKDTQGYLVTDCYDSDGEPFSSNELDERDGGGGGSSSWSTFLQCLDDATSGLTMPANRTFHSGKERHHIFSDKSKKYTPQYKEITDRYDYSLNMAENVVDLPNHKGRHTTAYHELSLKSLKALDAYAGGSQVKFLKGLAQIAKHIEENPWLPYARYGGK